MAGTGLGNMHQSLNEVAIRCARCASFSKNRTNSFLLGLCLRAHFSAHMPHVCACYLQYADCVWGPSWEPIKQTNPGSVVLLASYCYNVSK